MPHIHIIPKGKRTVLLLMDGENAGPMQSNDLLRYNLEDGGEITQECAERILTESILPAGKKKAMDLLLAQDRTKAELLRRLAQAGFGERIVSEVMDYIRQFPYLDDVRYAKNYLTSAAGKKSLSEIRHKLTEHGVSDEDYEQALAEYLEENAAASSPEDDGDSSSFETGSEEALEFETLRKLMRKKVPDGTALSKSQKEKLYASFLRKGFGYHTVRTVLKSYPTCEEEEN